MILKEEKAHHTTPVFGMKNNRETAFIHPFNKYLLCSFEVAGTIQGIGNIKWKRNSPLVSEAQGLVGRQTLHSLSHLQHNVINIMTERITRYNGSLRCIILKCY